MTLRHRGCITLGLLFAAAIAWAGPDDPLAATANAHQSDAPVATPAAGTAPRTPVIGAAVNYGIVDGVGLSGYLARPEGAGPDTPGLIVIHEWWGLNDNIRKAAERLAGEGYAALAVDLYDGDVATTPKDALELMRRLMARQDAANANLRAAYAYLADTVGAPAVGSIGWCLGGQWSLRAALLLPDQLDATVIYYGSLVTDATELATLQMPILGNFAEDDPIIPPDSVETFASTLTALGKSVDVKIYKGAKHAFANPSGTAYDEAAATDAWSRTTAFLAQALQ